MNRLVFVLLDLSLRVQEDFDEHSRRERLGNNLVLGWDHTK